MISSLLIYLIFFYLYFVGKNEKILYLIKYSPFSFLKILLEISSMYLLIVLLEDFRLLIDLIICSSAIPLF